MFLLSITINSRGNFQSSIIIDFFQRFMTQKRQSFINLSLIIIQSKEEFDKIVPDQPKRKQEFQYTTQLIQPKIQSNNHYQEERDILQNRHIEDIIIPKCGKIPNPSQFKRKNASYRPHVQNKGYIRLKIKHNLPNPFIYELTQQDLAVLEFLQQKYPFSSQANFQIQQRHMALIFKMCQELSYSKNTELLQILDDEKLISQHISSNLSQNFPQNERSVLFELVSKVFRYWKIVKQDRFGQPLIRKYWPKKTSPNSVNAVCIPYKSRSPGILEPIHTNKLLKAIQQKKSKRKNQEIHKNLSLEEWKVLYDTHCKKKKEFHKMMRNFHSLAEKYGFNKSSSSKNQCQQTVSYVEKSLQENSQTISKSERNQLNISQSSNKSFKRKQNDETDKKTLYKQIPLWIRAKKKDNRKDKNQLNSSTTMQQSEQISQSIVIQEDFDDDLLIVNEQDFHDLLFTNLEINLNEQSEVFTLNFKEQNELDLQDDELGSENFYGDLDWNIEEPQNLFTYSQQVQKTKNIRQKLHENNFSDSSDTTVYEEQPQDAKTKRKFKPKQSSEKSRKIVKRS